MAEGDIPTCSKGHEWTEANTLYESSGRPDGRKRRRCRQCRRDKRAEAALVALRSKASNDQNQARRGRGVPERQPSVERIVSDFDTALEYISPNCDGNTVDFTDWEIENAPSPKTASRLCDTCLVFDLCRDRAVAEPPEWGVWGGEVWVEGQLYTEGTA